MHLLVVTTTSDRSEVAIYAGLVQRGHKVDMLCRADAPEQDALRAAGVHMFPIHIRHRLDLPAARLVRQTIRTRCPDVVYAPRNGSLSVSLFATIGTTIPVVTYRGTIGHISRFDPASWMTYLHPRVRRIVCVSNAVRTYLQTFNLPDERLVTIYKGHAVAWYDAMPAPTRAELNLPDGVFLLGFTGRMRPVKGGEVLLQALGRIPANLHVHLVLVGEIVNSEALLADVPPELKKRIHLLGFRRDAAAIAKCFNAFVMPSLEREGLPRAVIEAMAQRVTPIVTNVGGMPELVENGVSGLVIPPHDSDALAAAISTLVRVPGRCLAMGEAARQRVEAFFNIENSISRMEHLFIEVSHAKTSPKGLCNKSRQVL